MRRTALRHVACVLVAALTLVALPGCDGAKTGGTPGASTTQAPAKEERHSREASLLVDFSIRGGGFGQAIAQGDWVSSYQGEWELAEEAAPEPTWEFFFDYDDEGRLARRETHQGGDPSSESVYTYDGDTTMWTTRLNIGTESERTTETVVTKGEDGSHIEVSEGGVVTGAREETTERQDGVDVETARVLDESGAIDESTVTTYNEDGEPVLEETYEGEPGEGATSERRTYTYDDEGREVSYQKVEFVDAAYSTGNDERYHVYADSGAYASMELSGRAYDWDLADSAVFCAYNDEGDLVYAYTEGDVQLGTTSSASEYVVTYNDDHNPTQVLGWHAGQLVYKRTFTYEGEGLLVSSTELAHKYDTGYVSASCALFSYVNPKTGATIEHPDAAAIEYPAFTEDDYAASVDAVIDPSLIDRIMEGPGSFIADIPLPPGSTADVARAMTLATGSGPGNDAMLMVYTMAEGSCSVETMSPSHYYTLPSGETLVLGIDGLRLTLTPVDDARMAARGVLGDGTEVDVTLELMESW